ncbi:DUF397 domain-containing protein [Streptomyces sp. NPDC052114]|uniref:DUF397 domain-containing protein n=1 Tax=unclassified Streptomyces TaxID=2593676 RepID=UPI0034346D6B
MNTAGLAWFKSSYSGDSSGDCVEVALTWRKSSYSGDDSGDCVEVAPCPAAIHIRDSKNPEGPRLALAPRAWAAFVAHAGRGAHPHC